MRRRTFLGAAAITAGVAGGPAVATPVLGRGFAQDDADGNEDDGDEADDPFDGEASVGGLEPLGSVPVESATEAVVGDDGETAYVATYDGFATVDVRDPAEPTVLATVRGFPADREEPPLVEVLDVTVAGDRLVAAGPANPTPASVDAFQGFVRYDVSDPANPVLAGDPYETDFHIHNCTLAGEHLYAVGNDRERNPLVIYDAGGEGLEEVGRWSLLEHDDRWADVPPILWYLHDVTVRDGVAVLPYWNAGTVLLDVSDPADPEFVSLVSEVDVETQLEVEAGAVGHAQETLPGNAHYAALDASGEVLAVGRESWAAETGDPEGAGGIDLYDVSAPESPVRRATIEAPATPDASHDGGQWTTAHNFDLREGLLYSAWYRGGVAVHDVSDPSNPEELARWRDHGATAFWTARAAPGGEAFVASSTELLPDTDIDGALYTFPIEEAWAVDEGNGGAGDNADRTPGFTPAAGLAGAGLALEWLRRRSAPSASEGRVSESMDRS